MSSSKWVGIPGLIHFPQKQTSRPSANPVVTNHPPVKWPVEWVPWTFGPKPTDPTPTEMTTGKDDEDKGMFDPGDVAFVLAATTLVFLMIPGLGFFYSGLARTKSSLSLIMLCMWSLALVSIQWFIVGYSLAFSKSGSFLIGNFDNLFLQGIYEEPSVVSDKIPGLVFCIFQGMFAAITPALIMGSCAERNRFLPTTLFIILWTTFVYDFLAFWTWNPRGWGFIMGGLDFAGGTPVHISSGAAALAYAFLVGKREKGFQTEEFRPHSMTNVFLGTGLLWFGWFGFNGGSALVASTQAVNACLVTNLSASIAGITWVLLDYRLQRKYSPLGFCSGAVAGLVCITPACGYVSPASSLAFGFIGAIFCNFAVGLKSILCYDDALDVFAIHGVGGITGNILTGVFAQKFYAEGIDGGGLDGNWIQVWYQLICSAAGFGWSFFVTLIILVILNAIPGCGLRVDTEAERVGIDMAQLGYNSYDFVEDMKLSALNPNQFGPWSDPHNSSDIKFSNLYGGPGRKFDYGTQLSHQSYPIKKL